MIKEIIVTTDSPIHLANKHNTNNYSGTLDYIPGSVFRGALASAYLQNTEVQQEINQRFCEIGLTFNDFFKWLFLSGKVQFQNLYPLKNQSQSLVIPISARSCKRFSGFINEGNRIQRKHGVFDILLYEPENFRCRECNSPMELFSGFYESDMGQVDIGRQAKAKRRELVRTSIENETESVRQGILYSMDVLEEGEDFSGNLILYFPENWSSEIKQQVMQILDEHLNSHNAISRLWIGGDKTRGLGAIHIKLLEPNPSLPSLEERFDGLQEKWGQIPNHENINIFTLTLNSDAIVLDELWRYLSVLDVDVLKHETTGAPDCCLKRWFTGTHIIGGWNMAHGLPKEDELAITKGSAFLYFTTAKKETLLPWLRSLEEEGIGERRNEGFGHIIPCHPFHQEVAL